LADSTQKVFESLKAVSKLTFFFGTANQLESCQDLSQLSSDHRGCSLSVI